MEREKIAFILDRYSCRNFRRQALPRADLELLLEAAHWAPSAGNVQPWFFWVVTNAGVKQQLARAAHGQMFVADAAAVFVVCADAEESATWYGSRGSQLYVLQDTAAACENILLAATALGYGGCWVGSFDEGMVHKLLQLPRNLRPVALVPVGPGEPAGERRERKPLEEISRWIE